MSLMQAKDAGIQYLTITEILKTVSKSGFGYAPVIAQYIIILYNNKKEKG
ncbi:MAG: hypothetical protein M1502_02940 [Deltaproteobacteria bacterium]|jgi:hypothetical protein|nr:hypothetical protein [Deltaproteobacteria bacterium]MCL6119864.1 hypothetical protein [Deltaproteobacteria bacterium]